MNVSTLILVLVVAGVLKLTLGLTVALLWRRRRARLEVKAPADAPPSSTPVAPQLTFVPRPDEGRQMVVDARSGHSLELAFHTDPGRQHVHLHDAFERAGLVS